jgi:hypothetical protein
MSVKKTRSKQSEEPNRTRDKSGRAAESESSRSLYREAVWQLRHLKRAYHSEYLADPKTFRASIRKAEARVFRLKPGPKRKHDPLIRQAACRRGAGAPWAELYPEFIDGYQRMTEHTRGYAEEGFRKKVNDYLRSHPRLRIPQATQAQRSAHSSVTKIPVSNNS